MLSWMIDGLMVVLLLMVLVSTMVLNGRLKYLKQSRGEFENLIRSFDEASRRADSGIKALQQAAGKTGEGLQEQLTRARALRDELSIMIDSADSLARRLEAAAPGRGGEASRPAETAAGGVRSKAEQDLLRAMGNKREAGL